MFISGLWLGRDAGVFVNFYALFAYTVLRNDAIDVVYGTMEAYAALGVPYMAHIAPTKKW